MALYLLYMKECFLVSRLGSKRSRYFYISIKILLGLVTGHEGLIVEVNSIIFVVNNITKTIFF